MGERCAGLAAAPGLSAALNPPVGKRGRLLSTYFRNRTGPMWEHKDGPPGVQRIPKYDSPRTRAVQTEEARRLLQEALRPDSAAHPRLWDMGRSDGGPHRLRKGARRPGVRSPLLPPGRAPSSLGSAPPSLGRAPSSLTSPPAPQGRASSRRKEGAAAPGKRSPQPGERNPSPRTRALQTKERTGFARTRVVQAKEAHRPVSVPLLPDQGAHGSREGRARSRQRSARFSRGTRTVQAEERTVLARDAQLPWLPARSLAFPAQWAGWPTQSSGFPVHSSRSPARVPGRRVRPSGPCARVSAQRARRRVSLADGAA